MKPMQWIRAGILPALVMTAALFSGCDESTTEETSGEPEPSVYDVNSYETYTLTEDMKYSLAHMWHEEKLARDIYLALNSVHPNAKMKMIADKGEVAHIGMVQSLAQKYDLNVTNLVDYGEYYTVEELEAMPSGIFAIEQLQTLYNDLYTEGSASATAALQVGCKVEVVDIDDLTDFIAQAGEARDLAEIFAYLRDGSYKHYWAFDGELKELGVSNGCCSAGDAYCKNYPQ